MAQSNDRALDSSREQQRTLSESEACGGLDSLAGLEARGRGWGWWLPDAQDGLGFAAPEERGTRALRLRELNVVATPMGRRVLLKASRRGGTWVQPGEREAGLPNSRNSGVVCACASFGATTRVVTSQGSSETNTALPAEGPVRKGPFPLPPTGGGSSRPRAFRRGDRAVPAASPVSLLPAPSG